MWKGCLGFSIVCLICYPIAHVACARDGFLPRAVVVRRNVLACVALGQTEVGQKRCNRIL